jgi:adenine-specific DNA-methyltransferase
VIKKIKLEESQKLDLEKKKIDLGFKVFKLGKSNFSVWEGNTKEDLEQQLQLSIENIAKSSTPESILYELLLKAGYGLEEAVEKKKIDGKTAYFVSGGKLSICLEKEIKQNLMKAIADQKPEMVICLNSSFATDADLTNAAQIMKSKQIEFRTV